MTDIASTSAAAASAATPTSGISTDTSRLKSAANLKAAGQKFEAVFDGMMLKAMRQTKLADPLFDSKAIDTFTEMQDARVAQSMAEHAPIGIGKAMTAFLQKSAGSTTAGGDAPRSQHDLNQGASTESP